MPRTRGALHLAIPSPSLTKTCHALAPDSPHTPGPFPFLPSNLDFTTSSSSSSSALGVSLGPPLSVSASTSALTPESSPSPFESPRKRSRDQVEWTPAEIDMLESVLANPPDSLLFAPGSMPPPQILDELTSLVLAAYATAKTTAARSSPPSPKSPTSPRESPPPVTIKGRNASGSTWRHSWKDTRSKLAALALAESRFGEELVTRKLTRQERLARTRPGMRRVNSMDFMDETSDGEEVPTERIGRVLRLSTILQNSARLDSQVNAQQQHNARDSYAAIGLASPPQFNLPFSLTLTPATPSKTLRPAPMRRRSSAHSVSSVGSVGSVGSGGSSASRRPSLLARGRSFTASDLAAEEAQEVAAIVLAGRAGKKREKEASPCSSPSTPTASTIVTDFTDVTDVGVAELISPRTLAEPLVPSTGRGDSATLRLTRSYSSSTLEAPAHSARDAFIHHDEIGRAKFTPAAPIIAGDNRPGIGLGIVSGGALARPIEMHTITRATKTRSSAECSPPAGGGPANDEARDALVSANKKRRSGRARARIGSLTMTALGDATGLALAGGLRSPFEEKTALLEG